MQALFISRRDDFFQQETHFLFVLPVVVGYVSGYVAPCIMKGSLPFSVPFSPLDSQCSSARAPALEGQSTLSHVCAASPTLYRWVAELRVNRAISALVSRCLLAIKVQSLASQTALVPCQTERSFSSERHLFLVVF